MIRHSLRFHEVVLLVKNYNTVSLVWPGGHKIFVGAHVFQDHHIFTLLPRDFKLEGVKNWQSHLFERSINPVARVDTF